MAADVLHTVTILGIVESLIFDFPSRLGHSIQGAAIYFAGREIRQPVGFHHSLIGFVLTVANDADGWPAESLPRVKIIGIPDFDLPPRRTWSAGAAPQSAFERTGTVRGGSLSGGRSY